MHSIRFLTMMILSFSRMFFRTESYSLPRHSSSLIQMTSGQVSPSDSRPLPSSEDGTSSSPALERASLHTYPTEQAHSNASPNDIQQITWREDGECSTRSRIKGCTVAYRRSNRRRDVVRATGTNTGDATYYGTGLGACGKTSTDSSLIAAASHMLFDNFPGATANPNSNPICGRKVKAKYKSSSVIVEIVDRCTGCQEYDLDFSPAAFEQLGVLNEGRLHGMTWEWIDT